MLQLVDLGQVDGIDQSEAGQGTGDDREHQQYNERGAAGELSMALQGNPRTTELLAPTRTAQFHKLIGRDSQGIQASYAFLEGAGEKVLQFKASILANSRDA
jgi:hypothetical protein